MGFGLVSFLFLSSFFFLLSSFFFLLFFFLLSFLFSSSFLFLSFLSFYHLPHHFSSQFFKMEASSATTSFLWKLQEVKKQYNITSWTEMGLIGVTCYLILSFLFSIVIGVGLPFASIVGLGGVGFCSYQVFLLAALSERLKEYEKQNNEYEKLNGSLEERVGEFVKQNGELKRVTDGLRGENERFGEEVVRLRGVVDGLELVEKTIKEFGEGEEEALGDVVEGLRGAIEGGKEVFISFLFFIYFFFSPLMISSKPFPSKNKVLAQQEGILKSTEETTQTQEKALLLTLHSQVAFFFLPLFPLFLSSNLNIPSDKKINIDNHSKF